MRLFVSVMVLWHFEIQALGEDCRLYPTRAHKQGSHFLSSAFAGFMCSVSSRSLSSSLLTRVAEASGIAGLDVSATARVHDAVYLKAVDLKAVVSDLGGPLVYVCSGLRPGTQPDLEFEAGTALNQRRRIGLVDLGGGADVHAVWTIAGMAAEVRAALRMGPRGVGRRH